MDKINYGLRDLGLLAPDDHKNPKIMNVELKLTSHTPPTTNDYD
jgi:hypothetical protein